MLHRIHVFVNLRDRSAELAHSGKTLLATEAALQSGLTAGTEGGRQTESLDTLGEYAA